MREQTADVLERRKKNTHKILTLNLLLSFFYLIGTKQRNENKRKIHEKKGKIKRKIHAHERMCLVECRSFLSSSSCASPTESHSVNTTNSERHTEVRGMGKRIVCVTTIVSSFAIPRAIQY